MERNFASTLLLLSALALLTACGGGGGSSSAPASSDRTLISFTVDKPATAAVIDNMAMTLTLTVPHDDIAWLANEAVTFTTTGRSVSYNGAPLTSGVSTVDLLSGGTQPIVVTAADGKTAAYQVLFDIPLPAWGWMGGSNLPEGLLAGGLPGPSGIPGARWGSVSWSAGGYAWIFGGYGHDASNNVVYLNDLWRFDGTHWTQVKGSLTPNQLGVYGSLGVAASSNTPGSRGDAVAWSDTHGNLWLFGGKGYDDGSQGAAAEMLNDLWEFDTANGNWIWMGGLHVFNAPGSSWGTVGGAYNSSNWPSPRVSAVAATDGSDNVWLFGGLGAGSDTNGELSDLWEFNGTQWRWVAGSSLANQNGVFGSQGVAAASNAPAARYEASAWVANGAFWLFGGDAAGQSYSNDLWKFDTTAQQWTWVAGSQAGLQPGQYYDPGNNTPGARISSTGWVDKQGNLWLFGGFGQDATGTVSGQLNDLWMFDGTGWKWQAGAAVNAQNPGFGYFDTQYSATLGVSSPANLMSGRADAVSWQDASGNVWIFGGYEDGVYAPGYAMNDLWQVTPLP